MDERRDTPPPPESRAPVIASAGSRLSPVQQAYAHYVDHATRCPACRDIDQECGDAEALWRAYRVQGDQAYQRLADETA